MPRVTITITEKGQQPYRFDLHREIVTIGRGLDNDIVVACGSVSGKHSEMRRVLGGYQLIDVGSTNGIKVDGVREQKVILKTGMTVKLGDVDFGFSLNEEELAVLTAEREAKAKEEEKADDEKEVEVSEKSGSKAVESKKDKEEAKAKDDKDDDEDDDDEEEDDDLDKLPELPPVRLDKKKEKEEQEAAKRKKAEEKERAKREERAAKEEKAQQKEKELRSERRKKRESSQKSENEDEYSESKAVTIGSGFILFTLIAAAAAFFYGAHTRHEKDTGEGLLKGIVNKEDVKNDAPADVDDKPKSVGSAE